MLGNDKRLLLFLTVMIINRSTSVPRRRSTSINEKMVKVRESLVTRMEYKCIIIVSGQPLARIARPKQKHLILEVGRTKGWSSVAEWFYKIPCFCRSR